MKAIRALASAALAGLVLAALAVPAAAAEGDPEMSRGTLSCYNEGRGLIRGTVKGDARSRSASSRVRSWKRPGSR